MAERRSLLDPFGIWRFVGTQLEKVLVEAGNRGVRSDEYAKLMHKALGASLVTSNLAKSLLQRTQELLNVPSRTDIQALGDRLQSIEDRLIGIASSVDTSPDRSSRPVVQRPATPPRTRKPPAPAAPEPPSVAAVRPRATARKTRKARE